MSNVSAGIKLTDKELVQCVTFDYHAHCAADPSYDASLGQWLIERGISEDLIWEHEPEAALELGLEEPPWL